MNMSDEFKMMLARFLDIPADHPVFAVDRPPVSPPPPGKYVSNGSYKSIVSKMKVMHDSTDTLTP